MLHTVTSRTSPPVSISGGSSDHKLETELLLESSRMVVSLNGEARIRDLLKCTMEADCVLILADQVKAWLTREACETAEPGEIPRYYLKLRENRADSSSRRFNTSQTLFGFDV